MFFFGSREGVGTYFLPTLLGLGRLPFAASRRRRPRHDNALSDRGLFDVGQRERVALAEAIWHNCGDDAAHRVSDFESCAGVSSRRHDDLERIPVLLDQAQLREARFELFDRALGRAATPAAPRLRFLQLRLGDKQSDPS